MITHDNLVEIFGLWGQGLVIGMLLGMFPFILGYGIQSIYGLIKRFA